MPETVVVCWEYADGSFGTVNCTDAEVDECLADLARNAPEARVWVGNDQVQQGYIAPDDRSWMF